MSVSVGSPPSCAPTPGAPGGVRRGRHPRGGAREPRRQPPRHPGRVLDDQGAIRRFVNVYVGNDDVRFLEALDTKTPDGSQVSVIPAVAGGARACRGRRSRASAARLPGDSGLPPHACCGSSSWPSGRSRPQRPGSAQSRTAQPCGDRPWWCRPHPGGTSVPRPRSPFSALRSAFSSSSSASPTRPCRRRGPGRDPEPTAAARRPASVVAYRRAWSRPRRASARAPAGRRSRTPRTAVAVMSPLMPSIVCVHGVVRMARSCPLRRLAGRRTPAGHAAARGAK